MPQQTVRDYLGERYSNATSLECRAITARARSHCLRHKIQFGRVMIGKRRYANAYDIEVLDTVIRSYVGLRKKQVDTKSK